MKTVVPMLVLLGLIAAASAQSDSALKFHELLKKRPGNAHLHHQFVEAWLETGTLEELEAFLQDGDPQLLAMYYANIGADEKALAAFDAAFEEESGSAEAWLERARIHARMLEFPSAFADLNSAKNREADPETAIRIEKLRGSWLMQSGSEKIGLAVWRRLLKAHPEDEELHEEIVALQLDEGAFQAAIEVQTELIAKTDDPHQKVMRQMLAADLHRRDGDREAALNVFSVCLSASGQSTWLEGEILERIEQVFRRADDLMGLKAYYKSLVERHPQRIALLKRQAGLLAQVGEEEAAMESFRTILRLTPGDRKNREAFVAFLADLEQPELAAEQMEQLSELHPDDFELLMKLAELQYAVGLANAAEESALAYLQKAEQSEYAYFRVARLLEQFGRIDATDAVYEQLLEAYSESLAAREGHAAFLSRTERVAEASLIWKSIVTEGASADAIRSAKWLGRFGGREAAYDLLKTRVDEFGGDIPFLRYLCNEAITAKRNAEAKPWIERRMALAKTADDLELIGSDAVEIVDDEWRDALSEKSGRTTVESCVLSELLERAGQFEDAEAALRPHLDSGDVLAISQQRRQFELRQIWDRAAEIQQLLVESPNGRNSENLSKLVWLLWRAGQQETALTWIEPWKRVSPGSVKPWTDEAAILREIGKPHDAIRVLRRASQRFEDDVAVRAKLADSYVNAGMDDDAEFLYWKLYEQSEQLAEKVRWAGALADLAGFGPRRERVIEAFEQRANRNRTSIEPLLALAAVYHKQGDSTQELEVLREALYRRTDHVALYHRIAELEAVSGEWKAAMATLEGAELHDPTSKTERLIAQLQIKYGDRAEGVRRLHAFSMNDGQLDADTVLSLADALIPLGDWSSAARFLEPHLARFPDDYRILYLYSVAQLEAQNWAEARAGFVRLLDWSQERIMRPAPANPSTQISNYHFGSIPDDARDLLSAVMENRARLYSLRLQSRRNRRGAFRLPMVGGSSSSIVNLPANVDEARLFSTTQLRYLGQIAKRAHIEGLAQEMRDQGVRDAEILMELPVSISGQPMGFQKAIELFKQEDSPHFGLTILVTANAATNIDKPFNSDVEVLERCYEQLAQEYSEFALTAAVCAAAAQPGENSEGHELLARAFEELAEIPFPSGLLQTAVFGAIGILHVEQTEQLVELLVDWSKNDRTFTASNQLAQVLRDHNRIEALLEYLDRCQAEYHRRQITMTTGPQVVSHGPVITVLEFPAIDLPGYAPEVMIQFGAHHQTALDPVALREVLDKIEDPAIKALAASASLDRDKTRKIFEELRESQHPAHQLLVAGFYASLNEHEHVVEILDQFRRKPMTSFYRQEIDGAIVAHGLLAEPDSSAYESAKAAVLRLSYTARTPARRGEVVFALIRMNLHDEAEALKKRGIANFKRP